MKIVNEKGKLFGIINLVDLVILLAIILVAAALVYKFAAPAAETVISPKSEMVVTMRVRGSMDYLDEQVKKIPAGERLVAGNDFLDATVVSVDSVPYKVATPTDEGTIVTATDPQKTDLLITVKALVSKDSPSIKIGNQEVRIGRGFIFKTQLVEVNAIIETVEFNG